MAENYFYLVDFEAICEDCGKRFNGVIVKEIPVNDSEIAGNILNSMADSVDAGIRKRGVEKAVREKRWSDLNMCYGLNQHECPHCLARQSWDPMKKPVEPKKEESSRDKAVWIGCSVIVALVIGFIVACIIAFIFQINFLRDPIVLFALLIVFAILGILFGMRLNRKNATMMEKKWPDVKKEYDRKLDAYNSYQDRLKNNHTRNEPTVALSSGRFVSSMEAAYAKSGLDWRDF